MKTTLFFMLLASASIAADITLTDSGQITKDGLSLNNAGDALLNGGLTVAQFQTALKVKLDTQAAALAEAKAAEALAESKLAALIAGARTAMEKTTTEERLAAAATLIESAEQTAAQTKAQALRAEIAAKEAELQKLVE